MDTEWENARALHSACHNAHPVQDVTGFARAAAMPGIESGWMSGNDSALRCAVLAAYAAG
ncbi:hypothetical protein [Longimicrobium sp.]|uniref:hypothetical protein n=1 Tax=Longimicrobium sp. TaxID=2029185 RepID=UPI003B3BBF63